MEWLWAALGALWTWGVSAYALWSWRAPDRWQRDGKLNNGLGMVIKTDSSKPGTRIWLASYKAFAVVGFLMAAAGALVTIGWLWKAIAGALS